MIDILNNPSKSFRLKKPLKVWIYPIDKLEEGTLLTPESVELGKTNSTIAFRVSSENNLDAMAENMKNILVNKAEREQSKRKKLYEKIIKAWEDNPSIFKKKDNGYSSTVIYNCSDKKLFSENEYMLAFVTGCGSYTFYGKEYFEEKLKTWDKDCAKEINDITKKTKTYVRDILKAEVEINSNQLDNFLSLENISVSTKPKTKPKFPVVFEPKSLNRLLCETGGDFTVDDELIEWLTEEEEEEIAEKLNKIMGAVFSASHEGFHNHDGQVCDYTLSVLLPDNNEYNAYNSHCLMTGWNFHEPVEFK